MRQDISYVQLKKRGWSPPNGYFLCCADEKSINHILIHCPRMGFSGCVIIYLFWCDVDCPIVG